MSTVEPDALSAITVAPNPASNAVHIELGTGAGPARIEVLSVLGTIVAATETTEPHVVLPTEALSAGVYAVRITTAGGCAHSHLSSCANRCDSDTRFMVPSHERRVGKRGALCF